MPEEIARVLVPNPTGVFREVGEFPARLLAAWGIDGHVSLSLPTSGTMNETWLVDLSEGRQVVLRRHRRTGRDEVEFEHAVMATARAGGVPCPEILTTGDGSSLVEEGGRLHSFYTWAPGVQVTRPSRAQAVSAGQTLARIQIALRHHPIGPWPEETPFDPQAVDAHLAGLADIIRSRPDADEVAWAAANLDARRSWLAAHPEEPPVPSDRLQVIHRDYQLTNLFFDNSAVSSVIDWDKARLGWPAWEVVRTLDYAIGLEAHLGAALLAGYRSLLPLPSDELNAAAVFWEHYLAHDLWVLEGTFLLGGSSAAAHLAPEPFIPFVERWETSGLA